MSYTLYYSPGTASMAVHWALIDLAVPFEAIALDFDAGEQRAATYLKLNPAGRVPTLVVDGVPYSESVALLMLLAERHPAAHLAPAPATPARAGWLADMVYMANTVLPAMRDWFYADKDGAPEGATAVRNLARTRIEGAWDTLDARLASGKPCIGGTQFTTVDYMAMMLLRWSRNMPRPANTWPHLAAYIARHRTRPSFAELHRREGLEMWPKM